MTTKLEHIDYEVTEACNLECVHCSAQAGRGKIPDLELIEGILSDAKELGLRRVGITGGEPFLFSEQMYNLIDFCVYGLSCKVHIHTNGTFPERFARLQKFKSRIENITLTLLGKRESHDFNSGGKRAYEEVKISAQTLVEYNLPLTMFLIPISNNVRELPGVVREFHEIGVRDFRVMVLSPGGRAGKNYENLQPNKKQVKKFKEELERLEQELKIRFQAGFCTRLYYPSMAPLSKHEQCMSGVNRLHISADGYVYPCTASSGFSELNVGNINEQSLGKIWGSFELKKLRRRKSRGCYVQGHYYNNTQQ